MNAPTLAILLALTGISSAVLLLILALRPLLRRYGGPRLTYASWLLLPLALAARSLPHPARALELAQSLPAMPTLPVMPMAVLTPAATASHAALWVLLWLAGVGATFFLFAWQQWRFMRRLGPLQRFGQPGVYRSAAADAGPAAFGLFRPRIVVPADFAQRYTEQEQELILAHERMHLQRGDLLANALCSVVQALFWFNPLVHLAAVCFRLDQELACDMAVLRSHPLARRNYAHAILKTQLAASGLPLGCNWQSRHPLKGRILNLTQPIPHRLRRLVGQFLLCLFAGAACYGAWAATAPQAAPAAVADGAPQAAPAPKAHAPAKAVAAKAAAPAAGAPAAAAAPVAAPVVAAAKAPAAPLAAAAAPAAAAKPVAAAEDIASYQMRASYTINGGAEKTFSVSGIGADGARLSLSDDKEKDSCEHDWTVQLARADQIELKGMIRCQNKLVAAPRMLVKVGQPASMEFGGSDKQSGFKLAVLITRMP